MNVFLLVWNYLKAKVLNTFLNVILLSLGIAVIVILMLVENQFRKKIRDNAKDIDLVIGAKGSPLQLILCNIFHIDFPTGNIKLREADQIVANRMIKESIPLALGDSHQGYRIIGTNTHYPALYNAVLESGKWWDRDLEVVIGSNVAEQLNLEISNTFAGTHGMASGGDVHAEHLYMVAGIMKKSNTVLDNLILCTIESVWKMHEEHGEAQETVVSVQDTLRSQLVPSISGKDTTHEITSILVKYRSPLAAIQLPRHINANTNMQAASPAFETARLFSILGIGVDVLRGFAFVLILISALSIFIALYNSLKERRYDMAIMRSMGATRGKLLVSVLLEGAVLTILGSITGVLLAHGALMFFSVSVSDAQKAGITGWIFLSEEIFLIVISLGLGILCAFIPAIEVYRADISKILAGN